MGNATFKGVIFDADGVLLDSMGLWKDLGIRYLTSLGITPEPNLQEILFSMSMEQGVDYILKNYPVNKTFDEVAAELQENIRDYYFYEVEAKCGSREFVSALNALGIDMLVLTSSPKTHVETALARLGLMQYFKCVMTTSDIGASKHDSVVFIKAAEELGLKVEDIMVAEDSLYALRTASEAGFRTIGVFDQDGESNQAGLRENSDFYVRDLMEALDVLNRL